MSVLSIHEPAADPARCALLPGRSICIRLFLTCWLIYSLHLATNTVREIYLALAIGDHFSFRVDEYAHMHPDLFEKKGYGWHIGANPGGSMLGAIPYAVLRPVTDRIIERLNRQRAASGQTDVPAYNSPWPMAREFYREAWRRGYDVKFGLASVIMQALCMAPISAAGVVMMFYVLRRLFGNDRLALGLAFLYAFGTPVFLRTGYLNHNLMIAHFAFMGLVLAWNPNDTLKWPESRRFFLAGVTGGLSLLLDYSGVIMLLGLFCYTLLKTLEGRPGNLIRNGLMFIAGSLGPIGLLWFYQWRSFGNPFLPGQNWMPPVEWIDIGYQGFGAPQLELLKSLLWDYRYGLFTSCPLMLLALAAPFINRGKNRILPSLELWTVLGLSAGLWLFCGGISYTRLQYNTGIRYLAPLFPFVFLPATLTLVRLPRRWIYAVAVASIVLAWCMAMHRDVERGLGVLDPVLSVFVGGLRLPILTVVSRMGAQFGDYTASGTSPLPLFLLAGAIVYGIWAARLDRARNS